MIGLVFTQLAARWGQALTLFVLSMAATVAAVSVPAFAVAIDRAAVDNELATAENIELVVSLTPVSVNSSDSDDGAATAASEDLAAYADARSKLAGFTPVTTGQIQVQGLEPGQPTNEAYSLLARDGFCPYVTFAEGRCPVGNREAALPADLAREFKLHAGDGVVLTPVRRTQDGLQPDGPPASITLVGVFEPKDAAAPYWVLQDPLGKLDTPKLFTNRTTLQTLVHGHETIWVDSVLPADRLTPERVPQIRRQLDAVEERLMQEDPFSAGPLTTLPRLLDRIEGHGENARALLPIAAAPLIALCWFVIHLAVGHGIWGRRLEIGAVVLRGAKWPTRAATVSAESLLPLLAGVPAGLALTPPLVWLIAPGGGEPVPIDRAQLLAAGLAAAGTLAAGLLALRRELAGPIGSLLRQVPPRSRRLAVAAVEVLAIALGIVVVVELRSLDGNLVGVMVAAPVLIILAVAMLASLAVKPLLDLAGRWSLRRGRIGPAVAAFYLARRPAGSVRLLVVLVLVFGTLGFAATATDVAAQGRLAEAQQLLGAARVLELQQVGRQDFLRAVRAADPEGTHAMAVVPARSTTDDDPPVVAVDSTRLARVALWSEHYGAVDPAKIAASLRPPAPDPTMVGDGDLTADLRPDPFTKDESLTVTVRLLSPSGDREVATFGPVTADQREYTDEIAGCEDGCRLTGVTATTNDEDVRRFGVTLGSLRQDGRDVLTSQQLADDSRWRAPEGALVTEQLWANGAADGLLLSQPDPWPDTEYELLAVDVPYPLPAVTAGQLPGKLLTNVDNQPVRFDAKANLDGLPGVGTTGALVDLEYAERLARDPGMAGYPQVWLTADAPASVVDRLREEGLVITGDRTVASIQASIDRSGAALALQSYQLGAGVTVLVGLGALALIVVVDRRTWSPGMRALRAQGTAERTTTGAALWSYGGIVVTSAVTGMLAAAGAWFAAGERLPLGVDEALLTDWPRWAPVAVAELLVVAVLFAGVAAGGWWQRHVIRRQQEVG
ncbi:hypothetical protein [Actinopolymorpha sp. B9G3]|uniref:hypothetical protein n=1 Tax=Actinopolymorpha sp. B9G3 TaxID=3158970 RepID=UPI0032D9633D